MKVEPFTSVNPNGRLPGKQKTQTHRLPSPVLFSDLRLEAIHDPNTGITLFESGAIVAYLISTYDKNGSLTYTSSPENFQLQQWAFFQVSGQGPYFGQAAWYVLRLIDTELIALLTTRSTTRFNLFHPEPLPSARDRYNNEIERVVSVLDSHLKGRSWLVGDKCTYADLAFVMWNLQIPYIMKDAQDPWDIEKYPHYKRWMEAMQARDSLKHVLSVMMDEEVKSEGRVS